MQDLQKLKAGIKRKEIELAIKWLQKLGKTLRKTCEKVGKSWKKLEKVRRSWKNCDKGLNNSAIKATTGFSI